MAQAAVAPITCHVLDTTTGRPAAELSVSLTLLTDVGPSTSFTATTDTDGRVMQWSNEPGPSMQEVMDLASREAVKSMIWSLTFHTGRYFGFDKTFFPEVEVKFYVATSSDHYHVPLLLSPWSYTTYRGS